MGGKYLKFIFLVGPWGSGKSTFTKKCHGTSIDLGLFLFDPSKTIAMDVLLKLENFIKEETLREQLLLQQSGVEISDFNESIVANTGPNWGSCNNDGNYINDSNVFKDSAANVKVCEEDTSSIDEFIQGIVLETTHYIRKQKRNWKENKTLQSHPTPIYKDDMDSIIDDKNNENDGNNENNGNNENDENNDFIYFREKIICLEMVCPGTGVQPNSTCSGIELPSGGKTVDLIPCALVKERIQMLLNTTKKTSLKRELVLFIPEKEVLNKMRIKRILKQCQNKKNIKGPKEIVYSGSKKNDKIRPIASKSAWGVTAHVIQNVLKDLFFSFHNPIFQNKVVDKTPYTDNANNSEQPKPIAEADLSLTTPVIFKTSIPPTHQENLPNQKEKVYEEKTILQGKHFFDTNNDNTNNDNTNNDNTNNDNTNNDYLLLQKKMNESKETVNSLKEMSKIPSKDPGETNGGNQKCLFSNNPSYQGNGQYIQDDDLTELHFWPILEFACSPKKLGDKVLTLQEKEDATCDMILYKALSLLLDKHCKQIDPTMLNGIVQFENCWVGCNKTIAPQVIQHVLWFVQST